MGASLSARGVGRGLRDGRLPVAGVCVVVAVLLAGWYEANRHWPYRYRNVEPLLQKTFASQVRIERYHRTYFPHPGFVAQGITLKRNTAPDLPPVGSADELMVQGTWSDLLALRRRVELVGVKGMHIVIPPVGSRAHDEDFPPGSSGDFAGPTTTIGELHLVAATLDLMRNGGTRLSFPIHDLKIHNVRRGQVVSYVVDMENAKPSGRIQATGSFGPLVPENLGGTPLSGRFSFSEVRLEEIGKLHGRLSSEGRFSGTLASIEAEATSVTPDFAVGKGRPARVEGSAQGTVDGLNGDVVLHRVELKTGATVVEAAGSVRGSPKVTEMEIHVEKGRAEDLLGPFLKKRPPIVGLVWVQSHAHLDPEGGGLKFLQRLHMDGSFRVPAERLTDPHTESALTAFSERAQGGRETTAEASADPGADRVSSLDGRATMRNGVLSTRHLHFELPGARADLGGTYDLRNGAAHLVGELTMAADLSHAATGWKSVVLKPLVPFFRKKTAGAVVTIAVTGVPGHYKVGQDVLHTK